MDFKTMLQMPVLDTNQVLKILLEIAQKERNDEKPTMPKVSITTHSDRASGFFVNYDVEKKVILLCDVYDRNAQFQYIESHAISSITLSNVEKYIYLLSDGKIPFVPEPNEIPTLLQLKKDIQIVASEVTDQFKKGIKIAYKYEGTPEDIDKYYVTKVLVLLKETLTNIANDTLANAAFSEAITELHFNFGTENKSEITNGILTLTIATSKGLKSFPTAAELQNLIEKKL